MFDRISPIVLSILLVVVLLGSVNNLGMLGISSTVLILFATFINYKRLGFYWPHLLLPIFFLIGITTAYAIIPSPSIRLVFLVLAVVSFFYLEKQLGHESHYLQNMFLVSVFLVYVALFAARFYFVDISFWWELAGIAVLTIVFIMQGFAGISLPSKKYFSLLIVAVITESGLGLMLWPSHFLVNAVVLFLLFYLLWTFASAAFFGKLTSKKIYWQSTLIFIVLLLILATAAWQPLLG